MPIRQDVEAKRVVSRFCVTTYGNSKRSRLAASEDFG